MSEIHYRRLTDENDPDYASYMELYHSSFPIHEQREPASQRNIMRLSDYRFDRIYDGSEFVGLMLNWETEHFIYVEHFCILPEKRSLGYGQKALRLLAERRKPVILEIDPPIDEISIRRKAFYERAGFYSNNYSHVHPAYHDGFDGHDLIVMSSPNMLTPAEYDRFMQYLCKAVMGN
ncbi:MAG: GNAT family N-acetyltransferase [Solobacterium sp.]|nr:GNAT family N-acetyltransferase [Solobacterium sp.]